jgi:hypothetical protein
MGHGVETASFGQAIDATLWRRWVVCGGTASSTRGSVYVILHTNSSLRTHLSLVAVVALGALQILLVWRLRQPRRWWVPPSIELALSVPFSIVVAQSLGRYLEACEGEVPNTRCVVQLPLIFHDGWVAMFAVVGIGIGLFWTWTARIPSDTTGNAAQFQSAVHHVAS